MKDIIFKKKKNFLARALKDPRFKQKVVKPKRGKGSFKRKKIK
jgi:stalled ribosome alternative rescue factor ArfA